MNHIVDPYNRINNYVQFNISEHHVIIPISLNNDLEAMGRAMARTMTYDEYHTSYTTMPIDERALCTEYWTMSDLFRWEDPDFAGARFRAQEPRMAERLRIWTVLTVWMLRRGVRETRDRELRRTLYHWIEIRVTALWRMYTEHTGRERDEHLAPRLRRYMCPHCDGTGRI